jgi:hypothetical protein
MSGEHDLALHLRVLAAELLGDAECSVVGASGSENDFKIRVVLPEKALEIFRQPWFHSVHWLKQRRRRER